MKRLVALAGAIVALVAVSSASGAKSPSNWSVKPNKLSFGSMPAGQSSNPMAITVTNRSSVTEQVAGAHVMTGDLADFSVQGSSSCVFPQPVFVVPGSSCVVNVVFNPQTVGTFKATVQIDLNPGPPADITVTGRGT